MSPGQGRLLLLTAGRVRGGGASQGPRAEQRLPHAPRSDARASSAVSSADGPSCSAAGHWLRTAVAFTEGHVWTDSEKKGGWIPRSATDRLVTVVKAFLCIP